MSNIDYKLNEIVAELIKIKNDLLGIKKEIKINKTAFIFLRVDFSLIKKLEMEEKLTDEKIQEVEKLIMLHTIVISNNELKTIH